jgi:hypothetical protein
MTGWDAASMATTDAGWEQRIAALWDAIDDSATSARASRRSPPG